MLDIASGKSDLADGRRLPIEAEPSVATIQLGSALPTWTGTRLLKSSGAVSPCLMVLITNMGTKYSAINPLGAQKCGTCSADRVN